MNLLKSLKNKFFLNIKVLILKISPPKAKKLTDSFGLTWIYDWKSALDQHLKKDFGLDFGLPHRIKEIIKVNERGVALDIGANIGQWTIPLSLYFKEVYSYEPVPKIYAKLNKNINVNKRHNVFTSQLAISKDIQKKIFFIQSSIDGDGKLNDGLSGFVERTKYVKYKNLIQTSTIDNERTKINKSINFIKIDVEGHEFESLQGGLLTFKQDMPTVLWEASQSISITNVEKCFEFFENLGYLSFACFNNGSFVRVPNQNELHSIGFDKNILSIPNDFNQDLLLSLG
jgi:FkbM family methyltransferase